MLTILGIRETMLTMLVISKAMITMLVNSTSHADKAGCEGNYVNK